MDWSKYALQKYPPLKGGCVYFLELCIPPSPLLQKPWHFWTKPHPSMDYDPLNPNPDEVTPAYGDNTEHVGRIEFDYSEVDNALLDTAHLARECSDQCPIAKRLAAELTAETFNRVLEWIWQRQPRHEGLEIRAAVVCWVFLPWLRPKTMSEIAAMTGERDKQSLGRWVDEFKRDFPAVKTSHMNNL